MAEVAGGFSDAERAALAERRWAICTSTFYRDLADRLIAGATRGFAEGGISESAIDAFEVPGAFELPLAAKLCIAGAAEDAGWAPGGGRYAGVACLGAVIRGETDHYDLVCNEASRGIQDVSLQTGVPCAFGVVTCDTMQQALARTDGSTRDQGHDAATAVMRLALLSAGLSDD
ncbi:MAG: 6,7-dimethyl-8-ribityllumazine synthase [Solirubrobacterales bacterium]